MGDVPFVFSDRAAGNLAALNGDDPDAVRARRDALERALGSGPITWMRQVHGRDVATVRVSQRDPVVDVDAMVTAEPGVALGVLVADCVPIVLEDLDAGVVAVAHAGRVGARLDVMGAVVGRMNELGASSITAVLGPSICGRCYEVPEQMQREVDAALPGAASTTSWGTSGLDLRAGVQHRLLALGVQVARIDRCTYEDDELYSHRRGSGDRFAGVVWR